MPINDKQLKHIIITLALSFVYLFSLNGCTSHSGQHQQTPSSRANGQQNEPILLSSVAPLYPKIALRSGIEGWVKLGFDIDPNGNVINIRVLQSKPAKVFDKAARQALKCWHYKPKRIDGLPVPQPNQKVVLHFNL